MFFMEKSIQEQVMVLFDYCGNIDKKHYGNYSPNNIRRLIISPDGVIVEYHLPNLVPKTNGKSYRCVAFNYMQLQQEQMQRGYKPIIGLALKRVCSSIEEIIFLTQSNQCPAARFIDIEAKFIDIRSFVRLHYITVVNMSISQFAQGYASIASARFLSDVPAMQKYIASKRLVVDKWYLDWGSSKSKSTYPVEMRSLAGYFLKVKQQYEMEEKEREEANEKARAGVELSRQLENLNNLIPLYRKLYDFNKDFNSLFENKEHLVKIDKPFLFDHLYRVGGIKIPDFFLKDADVSDEEAIQHNVDYIKGLRIQMLQGYFSSLVKAMKELLNKHPIVAKSVFNHSSLKVPKGKLKIPPDLVAAGFNFEEADTTPSQVLAEIAFLICKFFSDNSDNKYSSERFWQEYITK